MEVEVRPPQRKHEELCLPKEFVNEDEAPKRLKEIKFGLLGSTDIVRLSEIQVVNRELYRHPERIPMKYGCLDLRLGTSDKASTCETCGCKLIDCVGHFGYIQLELPVFHYGYFKHILSTLNMICKNCCRILLPEDERKKFLNTIRNSKADILSRQLLLKRILAACKKNLKCVRCGNHNGKFSFPFSFIFRIFSNPSDCKEGWIVKNRSR